MAKLRCRNSRGFSLLEVIISVGVLAIALVVILQSLSYSARITGLSFDIGEAVLLAKDKMQELEFAQGRGLLLPGMSTGTRGKFSWNYNLSELDAQTQIFKADFEIYWGRMNQLRDIRFSANLKNYQP